MLLGFVVAMIRICAPSVYRRLLSLVKKVKDGSFVTPCI